MKIRLNSLGERLYSASCDGCKEPCPQPPFVIVDACPQTKAAKKAAKAAKKRSR